MGVWKRRSEGEGGGEVEWEEGCMMRREDNERIGKREGEKERRRKMRKSCM